MRILLLCHYDTYNASMVTDHIDAFSKYSVHDVFVHSTLLRNGGHLEEELALEWFDIIVVHYSIFIGVDAYLSRRSKQRLQRAKAIKVVFLQDEYRFVQDSVDGIRDVGADVVFTCVPDEAISTVYGGLSLKNVQFVNTLTGYIPQLLTQLAPIELKKRKYHVSYRGRVYPDWHGSMGREKYQIAEKFIKAARGKRIKINISTRERDRVYGGAWIDLIRNSRAVLGVESGASVFDFTGEISAKTETMRSLLGQDGISYEKLRNNYFADVENAIDLSQVSPRVFEAISLRTLCVLYEGRYSGVIQPDVHYLALKKDFSNIDHVIARLNDNFYVSEIIANAYYDVALNKSLSYRNFIKNFDEIMQARATLKGLLQAEAGYRPRNKETEDKRRAEVLTAIAIRSVSTSKPQPLIKKLIHFAQHSLSSSLKTRIKRIIR